MHRAVAAATGLLIVAALSLKVPRTQADTTCAITNPPPPIPFTDVSFLCREIAQAFFTGLTNGTSPTTYGPTLTTTRGEMAAFITRTQDSALRRGSRRAALGQFWTPQSAATLGFTTVTADPVSAQSDGADIWVSSSGAGTLARVRASDGKLLETWSGFTVPKFAVAAMGRIWVSGKTGLLHRIDPSQAPSAPTQVASATAAFEGIAYDGARFWLANENGSVAIVTPGDTLPFSLVNVTTGFVTPIGIVFDGTSVWVADAGDGRLKKLDANGAIVQSVAVGSGPLFPTFDGTNLWVPNRVSNSVSVVRAATGVVVATLTGNGLDGPTAAAFDGQRVLVTNYTGASVSLWNAADLTTLGSVSTGSGTSPLGVCSDGINFWIALDRSNRVARF
jgi:hypothetical protein